MPSQVVPDGDTPYKFVANIESLNVAYEDVNFGRRLAEGALFGILAWTGPKYETVASMVLTIRV